MRKLSIIGLAISMTFILSACSGQAQAETNPTTAMETTVSETTTEAETTEATTISETTVADMGNYGEYGKEAYDLLVADWVDWIYADEGELRLNATAMLGSISEENYEAIIAEILSIDRGSNPYADLQTEAQSTQSESKSVQSTQSESKSSNTNIVTETKSQQSESTPPPHQSTPAPTQPPAQPAPEQQLAPGALSIEEIARREAEAGLGNEGYGKGEIVDEIHGDANAGRGYDWN